MDREYASKGYTEATAAAATAELGMSPIMQLVLRLQAATGRVRDSVERQNSCLDRLSGQVPTKESPTNGCVTAAFPFGGDLCELEAAVREAEYASEAAYSVTTRLTRVA